MTQSSQYPSLRNTLAFTPVVGKDAASAALGTGEGAEAESEMKDHQTRAVAEDQQPQRHITLGRIMMASHPRVSGDHTGPDAKPAA